MKILPTLAAVLASAAALFAQAQDGRVMIEKSGIALVKPNPWSPPSSAQIVRFSGYADRRARGHAGQGYFELQMAEGKTRQYQAAQVIQLIAPPEIPKTIDSQSARDQVEAEAKKILSASTSVPSATAELKKMAKPFEEAVSQFDAGNVLVDGKWISAAERRKHDADRFEKLLRSELARAKRKADFNLDSNSYFLALSNHGKNDPEIQVRADALRKEYLAMVAFEEQGDIIALLRKPETSSEEVERLLARLKSAPNPGEAAKRVLEQAEEATTLAVDAKTLCGDLNSALGQSPSAIPADLATRIQDFTTRVKTYRAGHPPVGLPAPNAEANALDAFATSWPEIASLMAARDFPAASRELSLLESQCKQIGENASTAVSALKVAATIEVDKFKKLKDEGQVALDSGNKVEAVKKFQEALAVMPDKEVEEKLADLQ
jgi:hypothetical protein